MSRNETKLRILHLEDNPSDSELVQAILDQDEVFADLERVASRDAFQQALAKNRYDLILSDFSLPGFDGMSALKLAQQLAPDVPFLFLSGTIGEDLAVQSLKSGAVDYVLKDRFQRLSSAIRRAHQEANEKQARRRHEQQIRQQAELLNQANDAIFVRDFKHKITYWSKGAERIYGWKAEEVLGKSVSELLYRPGSPSRTHIWATVLTKGEWTGELAQATRDGKEIFVSSHRTLLRDQNGDPIAVLNINSDITEKKRLESELVRNQRMDSLGALAAGIAHDLNNVLAPILMATELIAESLANDDDIRMVEIAKTSAKRGAALVQQILHFTRGTSSGAGSVEAAASLQDVAKLARAAFPPSIEIQVDAPPSPLMIAGDPTQVHQVLLNLAVNARDAMPGRGTLTLKARRRELSERLIQGASAPVTGEFVEFTVQDTGTGMPPEVKARIFEPFFTTKSEGKGTGLGLSTVATIVRNHRGFVELESEPGKGTTFRVLLPMVAESGPIETNRVDERALFGHGETILLIDDELALVEMTKEILSAHDYEPIAVINGAEALACLEKRGSAISVVITDLLMPGLSGRELIRAIRERAPHAKIICLSGSADETWLGPGGVGADAVLRKPCPTDKLLSTLRGVLDENSAPHSA